MGYDGSSHEGSVSPQLCTSLHKGQTSRATLPTTTTTCATPPPLPPRPCANPRPPPPHVPNLLDAAYVLVNLKQLFADVA